MPLVGSAAVALYDHSDSLSPLVDLVKPFLPLSLPLYSTLLTPGVPLAVYATFELGTAAQDHAVEEPWLVIADLKNQLRFFCSVEGERERAPERLQQAQTLVGNGLRRYLEAHSRGRDRISIGAIPDIWRNSVRDMFGTEPFSASEIHYRRLQDLPPLPSTNGATTEGSTSSRDEYVTTEGRLEDVAEILSTSEVPHPPAYLETRLPYTTVLRSSSSSPSSHTAAASPPTSDKQSPPPPPPPRGGKILAHCTAHRDGSIGTLYVSPSARRRGYGRLVFLARAIRMRDVDSDGKGSSGSGYVYAYVHKENESSNALMRSCGMDKSGYEVWWARVKLPLSSLSATGGAP